MGASAGSIRAGRAFVELYSDDSKLVRGLTAAQAKLQAWGASIRALGTKVFAAGFAGIGAFGAAAKLFADFGSELNDMSDRTGVSVEALASFKYAADQAGASLEDVEAGVRKMQKNLVEAASGSLDMRKELLGLGLSVQQLANLSPEEQFRAIAGGIAALPNAANRTAAAMKLMGKSATQLLPMMEQLAESEARFQKLGLGFSTEDAKRADALGDALGDLWAVAKRFAQAIGSALAPELTQLVTWVAENAASAIRWARENKGLIVSAAKLTAIVAGAGAGLFVLGSAFSAVGSVLGVTARLLPLVGGAFSLVTRAVSGLWGVLTTGVGTIAKGFLGIVTKLGGILAGGFSAALSAAGTAFAYLITPMGLLTAGLVGLTAYLIYASGIWKGWFDALKSGWENLKTDALAAFGGIRSALAAGDIAAAWQVIVTLLKLEWQRATGYMMGRWIEFKTFILDVWNNASADLAKFFVNALAGIESAWVSTVGFLDSIWTGFINFFASAWQKSINALAGPIAQLIAWWQGLDPADVEAELRDIQKFENAKVTSDNAARTQKLQEREATRTGRLNNIEADRQSNVAGIEAQRKADEDARRAGADAQLKQIEDDLKNARINFDEAVKRANAAGQTSTEEAARKKAAGAVQGEAKLTTTGTFSAAAVGGLGAESAAQRTARASEETAKNTRDLKRQQRQGNGLKVGR